MLKPPDTCFTVFHRYLPTMELLIWGVPGCNDKFFVAVTSMGEDLAFAHPITPTETIEMSIRDIMLIAHKKMMELAKTEQLQAIEDGHSVH